MRVDIHHLLNFRRILYTISIIVLLSLVLLMTSGYADAATSARALPSADMLFLLVSVLLPVNAFFLYRYDVRLTKTLDDISATLLHIQEEATALRTDFTKLKTQHDIITGSGQIQQPQRIDC